MKRCIPVFIGAACLSLALSSLAADSPRPLTVGTALKEALDARRQEQVQAAASLPAFHNFTFTDRLKESGITFHHHVVDDAGKTYKAVHYDHGNGLSIADIDNDGLLDIYFTTQLGSNSLHRNLGGGKFQDITVGAGLALPDQISVAASFADIDNDGDPDLYVTTVRKGNHLFENLGGGKFKDITTEAGVGYSGHSSGAVFFDYDRDGLLDLFLCNVGVYTTEEKGRGGFYIGFKDAFAGHTKPERREDSILYKNLGDKKFKDITKETGLGDEGWTGDATFADLNADGYLDLYVFNMQGDDHFYENNAGKKLTDKTASYFPKTSWGAMGGKFFDWNQDGLLDLYVVDMHSDMTDSATRTSKITATLPFEKKKSEAWCAIQWTDEWLQGASNNIFGNCFYQNNGGGAFTEISDKNGTETFWPWGMSAGDLNADGYEDLFVTAGMGYGFRYAINSLLLNAAGKRFADAEFLLGVEPRAGGRHNKVAFTLHCDGEDRNDPRCQGRAGSLPIYEALSTRSSVMFDLENDGDLDIVTLEMNDRPQVLVSNLSEKKKVNFVKLKLVGTKSNRDGLGAIVKVTANGKTWTQQHDGKSGYFAQSSTPLYFGLGEASQIEKVEITWPSGTRQTVTRQLPINSLVQLSEE